MAEKLLTKSKYMNGLQCLKMLWLLCNDPQKVPPPDAHTQHMFDQGHQVTDMAKKLFPGGIDVPFDDFMGNIRTTRRLLAERAPLFEPGFMAGGLFARLDILNPASKTAWDIIEVKSAAGIKEEYLNDVSFQKFCLEKQGLEINRCFLAHLNSHYIKQGEIDPARLFTIEDITEKVALVGDGIKDRVAKMLEVMSSQDCPEMLVGTYCYNPYECMVQCCWDEIPPHNIFSLTRGGKKCFELYYEGILNIKEIPEAFPLNRLQEIQRMCEIDDAPHVENESLQYFLDKIKPPVYYLDFETINPAIPLYDGMHPFQKIPFQFSLHVKSGDGLLHYSFLADGKDDPRPAFLRRLKDTLGDSGSIVTYNQNFEEGVLKELAAAFPEYAEWVEGVRTRLVDLMKPFQSFSYYHPQQKGSASLKSILPALTGKSYEGMGIAGGEDASQAFLDITCGNLTEDECQKIRNDLEEYCGLDSEGMVWIMQKLREIAQEHSC